MEERGKEQENGWEKKREMNRTYTLENQIVKVHEAAKRESEREIEKRERESTIKILW